jgi:hypothetical protein
MSKKTKKYVGNIELWYKSDIGIPLSRNVFAYHNTAKDLKETFLPLCKSKNVKLVAGKNCEIY